MTANAMAISQVAVPPHSTTYVRYLGGYYWIRVPLANGGWLRAVTRPTELPVVHGGMHMTVWFRTVASRPAYQGRHRAPAAA